MSHIKNVKKCDCGAVVYVKGLCVKHYKAQYYKSYKRSREGLIKSIYANQRQSSRKRKHVYPNYTSSELVSWTLKQVNFEVLYLDWLKSGFNKDMIPSIDRLKDNLPYSLDNIRVITWKENNDKGHQSNVILLVQYSITGEKLAIFKSISEACRFLGKNPNNGFINKHLQGLKPSAYGFVWKKNNE